MANPFRPRSLVVLGTLAAVLALGACNRRDETPTAGQQVDAAIAKADEKVDAARATVERDAEQARQAAGEAARAAGEVLADSAITAKVKASLAADPDLSTLDVSVETQSGRVSLRGTAPDAAARNRATQLTAAVTGVAAVDNQLGTSR
jgi:hyperosmotically inducible protein